MKTTVTYGCISPGPTSARTPSWVADAEVAVTDKDVARQVAENVRAQAQEHGWTTSQNPADVGDQGNVAGTRLLSSKLDPEYGAADLAYEETASVDDDTGRFTPLPASTQTLAPSGPPGATSRSGLTD
ncbi:hypothetical protein [Micrococcus sp.]|uniref:hypothetical protein n=1 Tax=Micrococcus sp. TaxID=1271 RepID=UPI002A910A8A|nr:hypothetical protein [Micrococcus sp.]MDY6056051.1 hypothetical protein [Micrococcus sp.]